MAGFATMGTMAIWYALAEDRLMQGVPHAAAEASKTKKERKAAKRAEKTAEKTRQKAHTRDSLQALSKLAERVDGQYRIVSQPPIVVPMRDLHATHGLSRPVRARDPGAVPGLPGLRDDRRQLLERFRFVDLARKVVGVGSVGTRAFIVLLEGRDEQDPLFLQVKEATASVLEDHLPRSRYKRHGERVVQGQRMMQAASDICLGWTKGTRRQPALLLAPARDMKGSAEGVGKPRWGSTSMPASVGGPWPGPARSGIRWRSPLTWGRTTSSTVDRRLLQALCRPERARLPGVHRGGRSGRLEAAGRRRAPLSLGSRRRPSRTGRPAPRPRRHPRR